MRCFSPWVGMGLSIAYARLATSMVDLTINIFKQSLAIATVRNLYLRCDNCLVPQMLRGTSVRLNS